MDAALTVAYFKINIIKHTFWEVNVVWPEAIIAKKTIKSTRARELTILKKYVEDMDSFKSTALERHVHNKYGPRGWINRVWSGG